MSFVRATLLSSKGTAIVESTMAIVAIALLVFMIAAVCYFFFAKVTVSSVGYNATICMAKRHPRHFCMHQARQTLNTHLPFGQLHQLQMSNNRGQFKTQLQWQMYGDHTLKYQKSLRY